MDRPRDKKPLMLREEAPGSDLSLGRSIDKRHCRPETGESLGIIFPTISSSCLFVTCLPLMPSYSGPGHSPTLPCSKDIWVYLFNLHVFICVCATMCQALILKVLLSFSIKS